MHMMLLCLFVKGQNGEEAHNHRPAHNSLVTQPQWFFCLDRLQRFKQCCFFTFHMCSITVCEGQWLHCNWVWVNIPKVKYRLLFNYYNHTYKHVPQALNICLDFLWGRHIKVLFHVLISNVLYTCTFHRLKKSTAVAVPFILKCTHFVMASFQCIGVLSRYDSVALDAAWPDARFTRKVGASSMNGLQNASFSSTSSSFVSELFKFYRKQFSPSGIVWSVQGEVHHHYCCEVWM